MAPTKADLEKELAEKEQQIQELLAQRQENQPNEGAAAAAAEAPPAWLMTFLQAQQKMQQEHLQAQEKLQLEQQRLHRDELKAQAQRMDALDTTMKSVVDKLVEQQKKAKEERATGPKPVPPPKLSSEITLAKFKTWKATWEDYAKLSKMGDMTEEQQRALLYQNLSQDMRRVLDHAVVLDPAVDKTPNAILDKIEEHVRKKRNVTVDLVAFDNRRQRQGETAENYLVAIKELAADADLTAGHCQDCRKACLERRLTARLISGGNNEETRQKLLAMTPFPTLNKVIDKINAEESAARDNDSLRGRQINRNTADGRGRSQGRDRSQSQARGTCTKCGKGHSPNQTCPAEKSTCNVCKNKGHFTDLCFFAKSNNNGTDNNKATTTTGTDLVRSKEGRKLAKSKSTGSRQRTSRLRSASSFITAPPARRSGAASPSLTLEQKSA